MKRHVSALFWWNVTIISWLVLILLDMYFSTCTTFLLVFLPIHWAIQQSKKYYHTTLSTCCSTNVKDVTQMSALVLCLNNFQLIHHILWLWVWVLVHVQFWKPLYYNLIKIIRLYTKSSVQDNFDNTNQLLENHNDVI